MEFPVLGKRARDTKAVQPKLRPRGDVGALAHWCKLTDGSDIDPQSVTLQAPKRPCKRFRPLVRGGRHDITSYLRGRELGVQPEIKRKRLTRDAYLTHQPGTLKEHEANVLLLKQFDKCFATTWLDEENVLIGTKCNKLLVLNTNLMHRRHAVCHTTIPLPDRLGPATEQDRPMNRLQHIIQSASREVHELQRPTVPQHPTVPRGAQTLFLSELEDNCGIHAIAINPSGTRMVTGGAHPQDCAVFSLPGIHATTLCTGHTDWVFGLDWITDNVFASGSRDKTVKLWCVPTESENDFHYWQMDSYLHSVDAHVDKVRDIKYCHKARRLASLSTDGQLNFTDPETMAVVEQQQLCGRKELVCLATNGNRWLKHPAGIGGSLGVADIGGEESVGESGSSCFAFQTGAGWLDRQHHVYTEHFVQSHISNACYAHAWDATSTRLFVAGGPLAYGLRGCYMAMWM